MNWSRNGSWFFLLGMLFFQGCGEKEKIYSERRPAPNYVKLEGDLEYFENITGSSGIFGEESEVRYSFNTIEGSGPDEPQTISQISYSSSGEENGRVYNIYAVIQITKELLVEGEYEFDSYTEMLSIEQYIGVYKDLNLANVQFGYFDERLPTGMYPKKHFLSENGTLSVSRSDKGLLIGEFEIELAFVKDDQVQEAEVKESAIVLTGRFIIE